MKKGLIIFDFDGVLADSFEAFYLLIKDSMACVGLELSRDQYRNFFVGNVHRGFKNFINNEKKYSAFSEFRRNNYDRYYYNEDNGVKFYSGAAKFLEKISKQHVLTIASSGQKDNIQNLLEENGAGGLFGLVLADTSHSKEGMINEILDRFRIKSEGAVMVSDTVGDILVAKTNGLKAIAVTWGFHSAKELNKAKPDALVNNFDELFFLIDKSW